jgi:hypothetical protein
MDIEEYLINHLTNNNILSNGAVEEIKNRPVLLQSLVDAMRDFKNEN